MKRKLLLMMASLLLAGAVSAQTNYWGNDPNSHAQPSNTPIVASIQIGGENVTPTADYRLGAFIDGNLWGIAAPHTDAKFWIQVFYETAGAEISFKLYNGSNEYTTCAVVEPTTMTAVTTSEVGAVVTLNFTNGQTVELAAGWNWWSTNVETTLAELKAALVEAEGNTEITISARNGNTAYYNGTNWRGSLTSLDLAQSYMIQVNSDCEITLTGNSINPAEHPVTITPGYFWIGYPYNEVKTVSNVFSGFASNGDMIMSRNGNSALFNGTSWRGSLTNLEPGQGYIYYSNASENRDFTFPSNGN